VDGQPVAFNRIKVWWQPVELNGAPLSEPKLWVEVLMECVRADMQRKGIYTELSALGVQWIFNVLGADAFFGEPFAESPGALGRARRAKNKITDGAAPGKRTGLKRVRVHVTRDDWETIQHIEPYSTTPLNIVLDDFDREPVELITGEVLPQRVADGALNAVP
jgi:hypothetical protein